MFLDDLRMPENASSSSIIENMNEEIVIVRSSAEALEKIKERGWPKFISFDHDLGEDDTAMKFLHKLFEIWEDGMMIPDYVVHSDNPVGAKNIVSFMETWKRYG